MLHRDYSFPCNFSSLREFIAAKSQELMLDARQRVSAVRFDTGLEGTDVNLVE
jgi:hypothetical protein